MNYFICCFASQYVLEVIWVILRWRSQNNKILSEIYICHNWIFLWQSWRWQWQWWWQWQWFCFKLIMVIMISCMSTTMLFWKKRKNNNDTKPDSDCWPSWRWSLPQGWPQWRHRYWPESPTKLTTQKNLRYKSLKSIKFSLKLFWPL